jgi:hypothetical protein
MADLYTKVELYALSNGITKEQFKDFLLSDNGEGAFIENWDFDIPKPTDAQLDALESDADDYEYNLRQIAKRKAEYGSLEQQIENIMENGVTAEKNRVQSIKEKYPKK